METAKGNTAQETAISKPSREARQDSILSFIVAVNAVKSLMDDDKDKSDSIVVLRKKYHLKKNSIIGLNDLI